ncbi:hypothetical protein Emag_003759 [Eimeria magna]
MTQGSRLLGLLGGVVFLCSRFTQAKTAAAGPAEKQVPSRSAVLLNPEEYPEEEPLAPPCDFQLVIPSEAAAHVPLEGSATDRDAHEKKRAPMDIEGCLSSKNPEDQAHFFCFRYQDALENQARARRSLLKSLIYCHIVLLAFVVMLVGVFKEDLDLLLLPKERCLDELEIADVFLTLCSQDKVTFLRISIMLFFVFDALFNLLLKILAWLAKTLYLPVLRKRRKAHLKQHGINGVAPAKLCPEERLIARIVHGVCSCLRKLLGIIRGRRCNNK